jgi:type I restriction enzyme S subunit
MSGSRTVTLATLLHQVTETVAVEDERRYRQITVRTKGLGLSERGLQRGAEIGTKRQFRVRAGQWLISRIDARNGAMGLVPETLDGSIVTQDFPVFQLDSELVDAQFFVLYTARPEFWDECHLVSEGSTNRVRLNVKEFLELEVDLPSMAEQQAIVDVVSTLTELQEAATVEAQRAAGLLRSLQSEVIGEMDAEEVPVGEIVHSIDAGKSPKCHDRRPVADEWGVLKVSAIRSGEFFVDEAKALPADQEAFPRAEVRHGDVLVSRANTSALVGAVCVVDGRPHRRLLCDKTLRFHLDAVRVHPGFFVEAMAGPSAREQIELAATGTSDSMKNVSQASLREVTIPLPSMDVQTKVAKTAQALRVAVRAARREDELLRGVRVALIEDLLAGVRKASAFDRIPV